MTRSFLVAGMLVAFPLCTSLLAAGPWTHSRGTGFVHLGYSRIAYDRIYDDVGEKQPAFADIRDNVIQLYGEYGVTDNLTIAAMVPFKFLSVTPTTDPAGTTRQKAHNSGPGDCDLTFRYRWLASAGYVASAEVIAGLPTGTIDRQDGLILGDGEYNIALGMLVGKSLHPTPSYLSASAYYNVRGTAFSDELSYTIEFGYGLFGSRLYAILQLYGKESTSTVPTRTGEAAAGLGLSSNNQEFTAIIPKLFFKASERTGISVSFATATHGRNVAGGFVLAGGLLYEF